MGNLQGLVNMAKKKALKYFLDHPQIKRNPSPGNGSTTTTTTPTPTPTATPSTNTNFGNVGKSFGTATEKHQGATEKFESKRGFSGMLDNLTK